MNYKKAKTILKKLNTLLDSFESLNEPLSEIEFEMLNRYTDEFKKLIPQEEQEIAEEVPARELYVQEEKPTKKAVEAAPVEEKKAKTKPVVKEAAVIPEEIVVEQEVIEEIVKVEESEPMMVEDEDFDVPPVIIEKPKAKAPESKKASTSKKKLVSDEDEGNEDIDLWSKKVFADLSEKLSYSPIKNIFKSFSINERMFTEKELFGGDHILFRSTLEQVELKTSFEDAVEFLKNGVAKDQKWEKSKKIKKAEQFMKLVQRRFI